MTPSEIRTVLESDPQEEFDSVWYLNRYPDVSLLNMAPADHYQWVGKALGRSPNGQGRGNENKTTPTLARKHKTPFSNFGIIRHNPLISVLIVSYNSSRDLQCLAPTLLDQTYKNFEVILVENGYENTRPIFERDFERFKFCSAQNVGFAQGNNLAVQMSEGEFVLLLNPDTRVDRNMLQNLLDCLRYDEQAAVAVPKINFSERFIRLRIVADEPFSISRNELVSDLSYRKIFIRKGSGHGDKLEADSSGVLELDIPYEQPRRALIRLDSIKSTCVFTVQIGYGEIQRSNSQDLNGFLSLFFNESNSASARYIVNNAGSGVHGDGCPYDRGFGQYDDGDFYSKCYVPAFCGCVALIRRIAILDRTIFIGEFFAYYEDSELSYWLNNIGYRILYQPQAIVYHRHSESTEEHSVLWNVLVGRSRQLYDIVIKAKESQLSDFSVTYPDELPGSLRDTLETFDAKIRNASSPAALYREKNRTVCIYNSYFSTMGGGEKHSLDIASLFRENSDVYLVSENDFDINELSSYFLVDLTGVRKIICTNIDTHFSSKFDIFINSTFRSNLIPAASYNFYIVSFPHIEINREIISYYTFLHNSNFTSKWAASIWGPHKSGTILPIIGFSKEPKPQIGFEKKKIMASVGRFTYDGHCKNHHYIIKAFRDIIDLNPKLGNWTLKIVGSCDLAQSSSNQYMSDLKSDSNGYNVEILPNVSRDILSTVYAEAAIYVHATGLNVPQNRPELHEHFGITCFEAILHGCLPVVYGRGGPALQVEGIDGAKTFDDVSSLRSQMLSAMVDFENDAFDPARSVGKAEFLIDSNVKRLEILTLHNLSMKG